LSLATRRVAAFVWAGMLATPLFFAILAVGRPPRPEIQMPEFGRVFVWIALAVAALAIVTSRALPRFVGPRGEAAPRGALAFARLLIAWAVLEGAALFPLVCYLITGDGLLFLATAAALFAHVSLFPTEGRWANLAAQPLPSGGGKGRMVR